MIKAVLFDLDGTLLPMDQDVFIKAYFGRMAQKMAAHGYPDPKKLIDSIWQATGAMIVNDGSKSNCDAFWDKFAELNGEKSKDDIPLFDDYYRNEFQTVKDSCGFDERAAGIIEFLRGNGVTTVLATNPLFPAIGTHSRARWAGLDPDDFELITTYENIGFCKPNTAYYTDILSRLSLSPADCIMVGNDVDEDIVPSQKLGMRAFLLTDCMINKRNVDISTIPHGGFDELHSYLQSELRA